jgi:hypothetical protein
MPSATLLTGAWSCDDGGVYYIRGLDDGSVAWAGLQESGFHKGIGFTNVFRGSTSADGSSISGHWADVPRGVALGSGALSLQIDPPIGQSGSSPVLRQRPSATTGGFGGKVWHRTMAVAPLLPQDIDAIENKVHRYDQLVAENNPACRDFTVMWGEVRIVSMPSRPPGDINDYCNFFADGWDGDGDFDFDLLPDFSYQEPTFWTQGWLDKTFLEGFPSGPPVPANEYILHRLGEHTFFHCEVPMWSRRNDKDHCRDAPEILLPGWNERGGNSVLVNGYPINGKIGVLTDHRPQPGNPNPPPYYTLTFQVGPDVHQMVELKAGMKARVTGVVADDTGHGGDNLPEIHPVYALDIVNVVRRLGEVPRPGLNLTGAWHGSDIGTYYLRQIENTIWWLGMSCDQGRSFANVFHGTIGGTTIKGDWIDVPMGSDGRQANGSLALSGNALSAELFKSAQTGSFGAITWTKLYDIVTTPLPEA